MANGITAQQCLQFAWATVWPHKDKWWFAPLGGFIAWLIILTWGPPMSWLPQNEFLRSTIVFIICVIAAYAVMFFCVLCWSPLYFTLKPRGGLRGFISNASGAPMLPVYLMGAGIASFVILFGTGAVLFALQRTAIVSQQDAPQRGALLHNWPDSVDKINLRAIFRNISEILNKEVSPVQLSIHQHMDDIGRSFGTPQANVLINDMAGYQSRLMEIRQKLMDTYVNGQDYADEAWDILGNTDALFGESETLKKYVMTGHAIQAGPTAQIVNLIAEPENVLRDQNGKLGDWVGASMKRLRAKQEALNN